MDKKAKQILFQTYWSAKGWREKPVTAPDDFLYAKEKGMMFDPLTISHDDCVSQIVELADSISKEQAAKAFLSSLSARRLDWRSGIASYSIAKLMTPHTYTPVESGRSYQDGKVTAVFYTCKVCRDLKHGVIGRKNYANSNLNVLNFERFKWGGVRHGDLLYTLFDLKQLKKEHIPAPTSADTAILKGILHAIDSCKTGDFPGVLRDKLKDVPGLKSNQDERLVLIEILACAGVLTPKFYHRPTSGKHDWKFAEYWRGEDGYCTEVIENYFGKYLSNQ